MKHKGVIWTNHILERMKERGLTYDDVYWAFSKPDETLHSTVDGGYKFYRYHKGQRLAVVAKKNEKGEWVMMTCWIKPIGQKKTRSKHLSFWKNLWSMITGK